MSGFDPDAYLAKKAAFDPDKYLADKEGPTAVSAASAPEPPSQLEALRRGATQGATMGFGDEIAGAIGSPIVQLYRKYLASKGVQGPAQDTTTAAQDYLDIRNRERQANAEAQAAHGGTYLAGNLIGGAASTLAGGAVAKAGGFALPEATTVAGKIGQGLASGLGSGALAGAGYSNASDVKGLAKDMAIGAGFGGAVGAAVPAVGAGLGWAARKSGLSDAVKDWAARRAFKAAGPMLRDYRLAGKEGAEEAGRDLLDSGAVKFGSGQEGIAKRLEPILEERGQRIGDAVSMLDAEAEEQAKEQAAKQAAEWQRELAEGTSQQNPQATVRDISQRARTQQATFAESEPIAARTSSMRARGAETTAEMWPDWMRPTESANTVVSPARVRGKAGPTAELIAPEAPTQEMPRISPRPYQPPAEPPAAGRTRFDLARPSPTQVAPAAPSPARVDPHAIADRVEQEVIAPLMKGPAADRATAARVAEEVQVLRDMDPQSFGDAAAYKQAFDKHLAWDSMNPGPVKQALQRVRGIVKDEIDQRAEEVSPELAEHYQEARAAYGRLAPVNEMAGDRALREQANRFVSPSDYIVGAGQLAHGGGGLKAAAAAVLHHLVRTRGNSSLAVMANSLANGGMGAYAGPLLNAAGRSPEALEMAHELLLKRDPNYAAQFSH